MLQEQRSAGDSRLTVNSYLSLFIMNSSEAAIQIYKSAVESVQPALCMRRFLLLQEQQIKLGDRLYDLSDFKNIYVIGAGKAAAAMALATEEILGSHIKAGIVAVKKDHVLPLKYIHQVEAGHPIPDENSIKANELILELLSNITEDDLLIVLLSGGGTSLLADLPDSITLAELQQAYQLLQQCGADIDESNTVRKHLSEIKGGGLAAKCNGATVVSFVLSDVIGNDLSVIASGPAVPDETTNKDALKILDKYGLTEKVAANIPAYLKDETTQQNKPKKGDACFDNISNYLIANNESALLAAKKTAETMGYTTTILSANIQGESKEVATWWVELAEKQRPKTCLLAGGETTVTIKGNGKGGRNQEFALAASEYLKDRENITILSAGTDGTDGPTDAAGAVVSSATFINAAKEGLDSSIFLSNNDSYHFFEKAGGHIITGPTQTNVMDLMIALID